MKFFEKGLGSGQSNKSLAEARVCWVMSSFSSFSARELKKLDIVNYAERIPIMRTSLTPNDLGSVSGTNDQWFLHRIQAQEAWDISTGNTDC